jgi:ABC-2 type transport system permease protein
VTEIRRAARALPTLLRVGFAAAVAYRSEFLIWILTTNMPLVMLALWTAVARESPMGRFGTRDFTAYFLVTLVVRLMTSSWVVWEMNMEIREGTLAQRLLRPVHPFVAYAAENLAAVPIRAAIALPIAVGALAWIGSGALARDPVLWSVAPLALVGAWALTFAVMVLIGTLALFWQSSFAVYDLWLAFFFVFAGYLLPLELLPPALYAVARWLPFRFQLSFPVEAMLGLTPRRDALLSLGVQWCYVALALAAGLALWRRGVARFEAYGG